MSAAQKTVFSEYEARKIGVKFADSEKHEFAECIGSVEDTADVKVITKKCRGVVRKKRVKATGTGVLKISLHCPWAWYVKAFGMKLATLIDGVYAYGEESVHEEFSLTELVEDEDGNEKLKAYPNCVIETGKATKVENGADEVAEIELEVSYMPDEFGNGQYEALASEIEETVSEKWLEEFTPELVRTTSA